MYPVAFTYQEKQYTGYILSSTSKEPHFHWVLFSEPHLHELLGGEDSVCFQLIDGNLICSSLVLSYKHPKLVATAKKLIEAYLQSQ